MVVVGEGRYVCVVVYCRCACDQSRAGVCVWLYMASVCAGVAEERPVCVVE